MSEETIGRSINDLVYRFRSIALEWGVPFKHLRTINDEIECLTANILSLSKQEKLEKLKRDEPANEKAVVKLEDEIRILNKCYVCDKNE